MRFKDMDYVFHLMISYTCAILEFKFCLSSETFMFYLNLKCNIKFYATCMETKMVIHLIYRSPGTESLARRSVVVMHLFLKSVNKCFTCVLKYSFDFSRRQSFGMHTRGKPNNSSLFTQVSSSSIVVYSEQ